MNESSGSVRVVGSVKTYEIKGRLIEYHKAAALVYLVCISDVD